MRSALVLVAGLVGCVPPVSAPTVAPTGDELTLYRDHAVIKQRVELVVAAEDATATVSVPEGTSVDDVVVLDRGAITISELRKTSPTELTFRARAPHAGTYAVSLGYVTDRIPWDAAYTMTTTAARDRATLRGAIAIRNSTGTAFRHARVYVVDSEIGPWRGRIAEHLGSALARTSSRPTPISAVRLLGRLDVRTGESRVELLPGDPPRTMRSVLVYDPIGTALDRGGSVPTSDPKLGVEMPADTRNRILESFEVVRRASTSEGLPGGPVRLLERHPDGQLALLGEARLFDAATRVAEVDTVAIGTADGVQGLRERRELTSDPDRKRVVEEFVLTITNSRPRAVEVVLREHLYRGQNWTLAYQTARDATKEGPQQIALRTTVGARAETKVLYVVVYTWP